MKKRRIVVLSIIAIALLLLTVGCVATQQTTDNNQGNVGSDQTKDESNIKSDNSGKQEVARMNLATAGTGGAFYQWGAAAARVISKYSDNLEVTAQVTAGSAQNSQLLATGQEKLACFTANVLAQAYKGEAADNVVPFDARALSYIVPATYHVVVSTNSSAETILDLKGKKIATGPPASANYQTFEDIVTPLGLGFKDFNMSYLSLAEMVAALRDRTVEAIFFIGGLPQAALLDIDNPRDGFRLLSFTDEEIKKISEGSLYGPVTIPAGAYSVVTEDVKSVGYGSWLVTTPELSNETAYAIAKALDENIDELAEMYPSAKFTTVEAALEGQMIPFHDGVVQYYKDKGYVDNSFQNKGFLDE